MTDPFPDAQAENAGGFESANGTFIAELMIITRSFETYV